MRGRRTHHDHAAAHSSPVDSAAAQLSCRCSNEARQVVTGPEGTFAFDGVRPDEYVVTAVIDGFAPSVQRRESLQQDVPVVEGEHDGAGPVLESPARLGLGAPAVLTFAFCPLPFALCLLT